MDSPSQPDMPAPEPQSPRKVADEARATQPPKAVAGGRRQGQQSGGATRVRLPFRSRPVSPLAGEAEPYKGRPRHVVFSAIFLIVVLTGIMVVPFQPGQDSIEPGVPAGQDIFSPTVLRYESKVLTDQARERAMQSPSNEVWVQDAETVQRQRSILLNNLSIIDSVRNNQDPNPNPGRDRIRSLQDTPLTQAQIDLLLEMNDSDYRYWRDNAVIPGFDAVMKSRRVTSEADLAAARAALPDLLVPSLTPDQKAAALAFINPRLSVNMALDEAQTEQRRQDAAANVKPVAVEVQRGETILRQGELITPEAVEKLQEAGLLSRQLSPQSVLGTAGIVGLLMLLLHIYIFRNTPQVWRRQKQLVLVAMMLIIYVGGARVILPGHSVLQDLLRVAAVSMLIAVLLSADLAVVVTAVLSVLLGVMLSNGLSMDLPVYYFVSGLTGIFSLTRIEKVSTFARAGFFIACASFAAALVTQVLSVGVPDWYSVGLLLLAAGFNGGVSTSVTYAAFSLLGTLFGITTPLQLMELAHPDQPLLRRLMQEAPGTYHHSLVVSNLAERAAEAIGADTLLARVCAYYHDIGKVEHPEAFIDNQSGMANLHDRLSPAESANIIAGHVRDGVKLGQRYKLPKRVLDAIPQHHGTMLIKYFYYKAAAADPNVSQDPFRYPGPRPQTKENAILMLADGVEATVRSMAQSGALDKMATAASTTANSDATESPSLYSDHASLPADVIAEVVHKIISERIEEGQLDECDLTVRDLARIQEAFVSMLKGIYHPRIVYPEPPSRRVEQAPAPVPVEAVAVVAPAASIMLAPANGLEGTNGAHVTSGTNGHGIYGHEALPLEPSTMTESEHGTRPTTAPLS
ncbi:MAG: cyclic-di-AMP phosphodiesterase PgpH [Chloroflexia bacterium]|nr:cyclic-di-AMP phosphodiesterase PgpH [Chloroflexia bacterium]